MIIPYYQGGAQDGMYDVKMIFWTEWRVVVFIHMAISISVGYVSFWTGMIINIWSVSWFWFSLVGLVFLSG